MGYPQLGVGDVKSYELSRLRLVRTLWRFGVLADPGQPSAQHPWIRGTASRDGAGLRVSSRNGRRLRDECVHGVPGKEMFGVAWDDEVTLGDSSAAAAAWATRDETRGRLSSHSTAVGCRITRY